MKLASLAACAGLAILAIYFYKCWPASPWTVLPRAELLRRAQTTSEHFGLNTRGWKATTVPAVSKALVRYARQNPADATANAVSPLGLRITLADKEDKQAVVALDSAGQPLYWRAPDHFKPSHKFTSDEEAARGAFLYLAGAQQAIYRNPVHSSGDNEREQRYEWRKPSIPHSEARDQILVVTKDSVVRSAEHRVTLNSSDDDDSGNGQDYWDVLDISLFLLCTIATLVIFSIYVLWLARRALSHQFAFRIAGASLLLMTAALVAGAAHKSKSIYQADDSNPVASLIFLTLIILCFVAVGRSISAQARPRWMSLEQLCLLAPPAKSTGAAVLGGLLFSPLLMAIPFLIVGIGVFPQAVVLPHHAEALYAGAPLLSSLDMQTEASLLGLFGFVIPALTRLVRPRWLRALIIVPLGLLFFADFTPVVTGPLAAPLTSGLGAFALFWFVYEQFDLLAVLVLQFAGESIVTMLVLAQKGMPFWTLALGLATLLAAGYWLSKRGHVTAEGDPRATSPALSGFRAEREKLRAEFSVARRAQQEMLPQTPPQIPGYSLAASCTPSLEVGGDLYDFLRLSDGRVGIGVADVSGKGVPAALYMTLTKGLLAAVSKDSAELAHVVEEVNRHLHAVTRKKVFVTMALGFLDVEKRLLQCVRAGHNPVVWRQAARNLTTLVAPGGLGLGITAGRIFSTQLKVAEMVLSEGDAVVFYSDGITEAMNSGLEQFGEERLMYAVEKADKLDAAAARDSILAEVRDFLGGVHPQDDMTIVVLRVGA